MQKRIRSNVMSWNFENPKTKMEALDLMSDAYGGAVCEQLTVEHEGISWAYSGLAGWIRVSGDWKADQNPSDPPQEVIDKLFNAHKEWWATQLDLINMIKE
jgi:hypothetical protein